MDSLHFLKSEELLRFFHSKKTEMSCMENPHTFLSQLRDHDLIPEDRYQEVSRLKNKEDIKKALYDILDQFEREQPEHIHVFWRCVFQEIIMNQYPTLRVLHKKLMDVSSLKKREQGNNDSFKLPVTCGDLKGTLYKDKLKKGEKCILFQQWFTPPEFEKFSMKMSSSNWKWSIRCKGTTLGKLMEAEKTQFPTDQASTDASITDEEEETEERTEQQHEDNHGSSMTGGLTRTGSFENLNNFEHYQKEDDTDDPGKKQRSSRMCSNDDELPGPSSQLTPGEEDETDHDCIIYDDVVKEASCQTEASIKKDINQKGKPLSVLTETYKKRHKELPRDDDKEENPRKNHRSMCHKRKASLKKAEINKVLTSAIDMPHLPVTCEDLKGTLDKDRMAKGKKCILFQNLWFTPCEFRMRAGNKGSRNWKISIRYYSIGIGKLIREGVLVESLKSATYRKDCKKAKNSVFPSDQTDTDEEETEEETEQQQEDDNDGSRMVFKVTCGALTGTLHKKRFASGTRGKSIRTEMRWMSPVEFVKEASGQTDVSWKRDIKWEGKPLSVLLEENILRTHSVQCNCELCQPNQEDVENQKHDDECCVCKHEGPHLVVCDHCPRSFHQKCHLPHVGDDVFGNVRQWMCIFCIFKTTQMWRYSEELEMQAALSRQVSRHMLECQYLLMYLCSADEEQKFTSNPNLYLKNYSTVVQTPMWFGKVADKLQGKEYHTVEEFVSDVNLIFTNCAAYNRDAAEFFARGSGLKKLFDREFKKVFNISE